MPRKRASRAKKFLSNILHSKSGIICIAIIFILCVFGASSYATKSWSDARSDHKEVAVKPTQKTIETIDKKSPSATPQTTEEQPSVQPSPSTTPNPNKAAPSTKSSQPAPAPTPDMSPRYYVTNISSAFVGCANHGPNIPTELYLNLGSVNIYSVGPANPTFSWRVESSYGSIHKSGTNTIPSNQNSWQGFPSTPSTPQGLGTILNIKDGEKVRFVITSPSYTATAWTNPVPAGSEQTCHLGQPVSTYL